MIIGCDFHARYQQIAMLDEATGGLTERRLDHQSGEAEAFYRNLQGPVRVGIEATGPIRWFERLLPFATSRVSWLDISSRFTRASLRSSSERMRDRYVDARDGQVSRLLLGDDLCRFPGGSESRSWLP